MLRMVSSAVGFQSETDQTFNAAVGIRMPIPPVHGDWTVYESPGTFESKHDVVLLRLRSSAFGVRDLNRERFPRTAVPNAPSAGWMTKHR